MDCLIKSIPAYSPPDTTETTSSSLEDTVATEKVETDMENAPDSTVDEKDLQSKVKKTQNLHLQTPTLYMAQKEQEGKFLSSGKELLWVVIVGWMVGRSVGRSVEKIL